MNNSIFLQEFRKIITSKFKVSHFIISVILMTSLVYVLFMLSFILGWLYFMEPASSSNMFSGFTVFGIMTINLFISCLVLSIFYKSAKLKCMLGYCKSYLIIGLFLVIAYFVLMPWNLIINIK